MLKENGNKDKISEKKSPVFCLVLPRVQSGKESARPANLGDVKNACSIPGSEDPLEKEMKTHSSILAWEIPRTEEPGRLQSMGSQKSWSQFSI